MPGLIERIQAKIELFRLEQRYTRRRNRRSTFVSGATYVDGEYVYQTPTSTGSSSYTNSNTSETSSPTQEKPGKKLNRFSSMPGFGSLSKSGGQDWRTSRVSVNEVR
jgi:hypothetical protein